MDQPVPPATTSRWRPRSCGPSPGSAAPCADDAALAEATVTLRVDPILDCVVVSTPADVVGGPLPAEEVGALVEEAMAAALASCMVEELIAGLATARPG